MTTIIKSNKTFTGSRSLGALSSVTQTPQEIYDAYAARVTADGGTIGDPIATLAAITAAYNADYLRRSAIAVSPRWGYKATGSQLTKLYNLAGLIDGVCTTGVLLDTSAGHNRIDFTSTGSITFSGAKLLNGNGLAVALNGNAAGQVRCAFTPSGGLGWLIDQFGVAAVYENLVQKFGSNPEYSTTAEQAHAILIEQAEKRITGVRDGLPMKAVTAVFTALTSGATANIVFNRVSGTTSKVPELWYLNNASIDSAMSISFDLGARY